MQTMTPRERILAAFEHREPDRVPAYDLLRNEGAITHYAGEAVTYDNWADVVPRAVSRCLDMTRSIRGPQREERIEGPNGELTIHQRWTTWHSVKSLRTPEALLAAFRRTADAPPRTAAQLAEAADHTIEWHRTWQGKLGTDTCHVWQIGGVGLHGAHGAAGLDVLSYALADDLETVAAYLARVADLHIEHVHAIFQRVDPELKERVAPVTFCGDDMAYNHGPMFSTPFLRAHFFPHLKRICDAYHEHGIYVMFHSDGDLRPIMDDFVATGIDGLNPIERQAGMDLADLKQRYGDKLTFCGGVDINALMRFGTVDDVVAATKQAILDAGEGGGYCCGSSTELDDGLPAENVIALLETIRNHGSYSRLRASS